MPFIAGQYSAIYQPPGGSPLNIGQTAVGLTIEHVAAMRHVTGDAYAETVQDSIFRGMNMFAQYTLIEYNAAGSAAVMWPFGPTYMNQGIVGRLGLGPIAGVPAMNGNLNMTAVAGTPAALQASPAAMTFGGGGASGGGVLLADGFPVGLLFAPDLREIPIRQRIYPVGGIFGAMT